MMITPLESAYWRYTHGVNSGVWTIGYELADWIFGHCESNVNRIKNACDLGSGFTSWVLRHTLPETTTVHSIDDQDYWITQTMTFLEAYKLRTAGVMSFGMWTDKHKGTLYDLIIFDLGGGQRERQVEAVLNHLAPSGICVLDDMHRETYRTRCEELGTREGYSFFSLKRKTKDRYGRWAAYIERLST